MNNQKRLSNRTNTSHPVNMNYSNTKNKLFFLIKPRIIISATELVVSYFNLGVKFIIIRILKQRRDREVVIINVRAAVMKVILVPWAGRE